MAARVETRAYPSTGHVGVLTDGAAGRFDFTGPNTDASQATGAGMAPRAGAPPADIDSPKTIIIPIEQVNRVELYRSEARVAAGPGPGRQGITSECPNQPEAAEVANAIVDRLGLTGSGRAEPVGLVRAGGFPILFAVIAGWLWGVLFYVAGRIEANDLEGVNPNPKGNGKLLLLIDDPVGHRGVIVLGVVLPAGFLGWIVARLVRRPTRTVRGSTTPRAAGAILGCQGFAARP